MLNLTIKTPEPRHTFHKYTPSSSVFIVEFKQVNISLECVYHVSLLASMDI